MNYEKISADISSDKSLRIGDVFTPLLWAEFAIDKFNLFEKWLNGATIFDPTMGEGNLLEAFISYGLSKGYTIAQLPVKNLYGNELNTEYYQAALRKFKEKYHAAMEHNFSNEDILQLPPATYDIIFGNPPWQNFVDLPESYKAQIKSFFFKYDLIDNSRNLLLGGSRIDIAALIIQIAVKEFLNQNGEAVFFMPLSLLLNDGANKNFRTYSIDAIRYSLEVVYDLNDADVFAGVATRYGLSYFIRDKQPSFPIPYFRIEKGTWTQLAAKPMFHETDPLSISSIENESLQEDIQPITIKKESSPRQGINTCGANDIYFFDSMHPINDVLARLSNKTQRDVVLPKKFIFPLITAKEFKTDAISPSKWVFLPYNTNGKVLEWHQIQLFPELQNYLESHRHILQERKGVMLNAMLSRGQWWAMLGVGAYNFFPYKIAWEAYGKNTFYPKIFEGQWQVNQSLQAYIPVKTKSEAERILTELMDKRIENYLRSLKMEGTMNWAQPGKIKKLLTYEEESLSLF